MDEDWEGKGNGSCDVRGSSKTLLTWMIENWGTVDMKGANIEGEEEEALLS